MSIIFKKKQYDFIGILLKKILFVLLIILILTTAFNFYFQSNLKNLKVDLNNFGKEKFKLKKLIKNAKLKNKDEIKAKNFNLLLKITDYKEKIKFEAVQRSKGFINLTAVTAQQKNIFNLIENLKADKSFKDVRLVNLKQSNNYYFQLEILLAAEY